MLKNYLWSHVKIEVTTKTNVVLLEMFFIDSIIVYSYIKLYIFCTCFGYIHFISNFYCSFGFYLFHTALDFKNLPTVFVRNEKKLVLCSFINLYNSK